MAGSTSKANGRSAHEIVFCLSVIGSELLAVAVALGLVPAIRLGLVGLPIGFACIEQKTRPQTRHVNYAAVDRWGVLHYIGKSRAFELRQRQHKADATGGRNGGPAHGKDWAAILVEDGKVTPFECYRTERQALRVERRITYPIATAVLAMNWLGVRTGLLPPRVFGNRDNSSVGRNSGGLRPWEWACVPGLALAYAVRPLIDPTFPQWTTWNKARR